MDESSLYESLVADQIEILLAQFVDLLGVPKVKGIPLSAVPEFLQKGCGFAGAAVIGTGLGPHDPDMIARADLASYTRLPWRAGAGHITCTLHGEGEMPLCTRTILRKQFERALALGFRFKIGVEPEFFLLRAGADGRPEPLDDRDRLAKPCYDFKAMLSSLPILTDVARAMNELAWGVYQFDHEDANGQFEVNFDYADAVTTADRFMLFKTMVADLARKHGAIASFMAKPIQGKAGSGMHAHFSLWSPAGERNLFAAEGSNAPLSELAYRFAAGVLAHARAFTALAAPTVNCYKRLMITGSQSGFTWVPGYVSLGANNRTHMLRIPAPGRLECRVISAANNPYLSLAALLAAGLDGIERNLEPARERPDNMYALTDEQRQVETLLPQSLPEALDALELDDLFRRSLGDAIIDEFLRVKRREWADYHATVSPWELDNYLETF
jgi:glutamine synthetase